MSWEATQNNHEDSRETLELCTCGGDVDFGMERNGTNCSDARQACEASLSSIAGELTDGPTQPCIYMCWHIGSGNLVWSRGVRNLGYQGEIIVIINIQTNTNINK